MLRIGCRSFRDRNRGVMYANLWMGAVALVAARTIVAGPGPKEEKEGESP